MEAQDSIRRAQADSLRTIAAMFGREGGAFSSAVRNNLGRLADRVESGGEDLEAILSRPSDVEGQLWTQRKGNGL